MKMKFSINSHSATGFRGGSMDFLSIGQFHQA
jgi:hypothetical protein